MVHHGEYLLVNLGEGWLSSQRLHATHPAKNRNLGAVEYPFITEYGAAVSSPASLNAIQIRQRFSTGNMLF